MPTHLTPEVLKLAYDGDPDEFNETQEYPPETPGGPATAEVLEADALEGAVDALAGERGFERVCPRRAQKGGQGAGGEDKGGGGEKGEDSEGDEHHEGRVE